MIIIGHPWIQSEYFCKVFSLEEIAHSGADAILLLEPLADSHTYAQHCQREGLPFAVVVNKITDALLANALGAKYILCEEEEALAIQPIATEYLFDTRILVLVHHENEIAKFAKQGIDGVVFPEAIQ